MVENKNIEEILQEQQENEFLKLIDKKVTFKPNFESIRNKINYSSQEEVEAEPKRSKSFFHSFGFKFASCFCGAFVVLLIGILFIGPTMTKSDSKETSSSYEIGDLIYTNSITYRVKNLDELEVVSCDMNQTSLEIPSEYANYKVTKISTLNSNSLQSLVIPASVIKIDAENIKCPNLNDIVVDSANEVFDSRNYCDAIIETKTNTLIKGCNTTNISNTIKVIGEYAFSDLLVAKISIPNGVKIIRNNAFEGCINLESIDIGKDVISIGSDALVNCPRLKSIKVNNENKFYDSRDNCNAIIETRNDKLIVGCVETKIPNTITEIGSDAFAYSAIRRITIPKSVKYIDNCAFYGCKYLEEINMNNGVTTISYGAFYNCNSLSTIYYNGTSEELSNIKMGVLNISHDITFKCEGDNYDF